MAFLGVDRRGLAFTAAGDVGDDFTVTLGLLDLTSGAVSGTGATIVATVGGTSMTVDYSTAGLFILTLSDSQTTTLGSGRHDWTFRLTPSGGDTQAYVRGSVTLQSEASAGGSTGWQAGIVNNVVVAVT